MDAPAQVVQTKSGTRSSVHGPFNPPHTRASSELNTRMLPASIPGAATPIPGLQMPCANSGAGQRGRRTRPVKATTFHGFPKMAKELQLKIWKLLLPGPRIIELKPVTVTQEIDEWSEVTYDRCVSQAAHPILLHICHTTRDLAQKIYKLSFEDELKWPVYMDPARDVLLLHDNHTLDIFASTCQRTDSSTPPSLAKIKYIILDPKDVYTPLHDRERPGIKSPTYDYPAYRLEEIAATYGSLHEIVVLKYPDNPHLAPMNLAGLPNMNMNRHTSMVEAHMRMLLRLSVSMGMRHGQAQAQAHTQGAGATQAAAAAAVAAVAGLGTNPPPAGTNGFPFPNPFTNFNNNNGMHQALVAAGMFPGGPWGNGGQLPVPAQHVGGVVGQLAAAIMAALGAGGVNANGPTPDAPWKIPTITAMTMKEVKERMARVVIEEKGERDDVGA